MALYFYLDQVIHYIKIIKNIDNPVSQRFVSPMLQLCINCRVLVCIRTSKVPNFICIPYRLLELLELGIIFQLVIYITYFAPFSLYTVSINFKIKNHNKEDNIMKTTKTTQIVSRVRVSKIHPNHLIIPANVVWINDGCKVIKENESQVVVKLGEDIKQAHIQVYKGKTAKEISLELMSEAWKTYKGTWRKLDENELMEYRGEVMRNLSKISRLSKIKVAKKSLDKIKSKKSKIKKFPIHITKTSGQKPKRKSIRQAMYELFDKHGDEYNDIPYATKVAKQLKPDTKFNNWHFYFYKKSWRLENYKNLPDEK